MNILVIISEAPPITSGVSRVGEAINSRLRAAGHVVDVMSSNDIPRLMLGEVRLSSLPLTGIHHVFKQLRRYDLVHIHGPVPTMSDVALLLAAVKRLFGGPPIVYTHHSEIELPGKELLCAPYNLFHRTLARLADHVVVSTPSYAHSFLPYLDTSKLSAIPWGVPLSSQVVPKPTGFNILYVGQLRPYKGLDVLLRAFRQLRNATLTVVGHGHRSAHYQALAAELQLTNVRWLGDASDEDVKHAFAQAHVHVLPSLTRAEAFGLVLLEGMAAGCVPLASGLPGLTDVIGDVGYTFNVGNVDELAGLLRQLQAHPASLASLAHAAQRRAEYFSWDVTAAAYERLFTGLVQGRQYLASDWFPATLPNSLQPHSLPFRKRVGQHGELRPDDLRPYVQRMFNQLAHDFSATRASLMLKHAGANGLVIAAHKGFTDNLMGQHVAAGDSVAGWVAQARMPLYITDANVPQQIKGYLRTPALSSALSVPLMYDNQVMGVINFATATDQQTYNQHDLDHLVASVASLKYVLPRAKRVATPGTLYPQVAEFSGPPPSQQ